MRIYPAINTELDSTCGHLGFYSSSAAFMAAVIYSIAQILQVLGILTFPTDAYWIYGSSLGIAFPFVISVVAFYYLLPSSKQIWGHLALSFAIMYAVYVCLNYVVQLGTVIPVLRGSASAEISVLNQTPHSLFWDVDALGYICMGISTLFLAIPLAPSQWKWLRIFLLANGGMVPIISFVYFYPGFSTTVLLIGLPWIITAPGSLLLLAIFFRRKFHRGEEMHAD